MPRASRTFDRSTPEDLARIAVLPSRHVQADSSSPFTGDLLLARTCNQGKIVDICRPSAGNRPSGGPAIRLPCRPLPSVPRPFVSRFVVASKVHERTEIARTATARAKFVPRSLAAPLLRASRFAREQGAIQIHNDVSARVP